MQFVTVRDFRSHSAQIWERLRKEQEMVVTLNGKPIAVLSPVDEGNLEESLKLLRRVRSTIAVESMQQKNVKKGLDKTSLSDINLGITALRKKRSR